MTGNVNIGQVIARERRRAGVTQGDLARHLGVSKAAVSKWELGLSLPDVTLLPSIAAYFSLTLDELFDWRAELSEGESAALYAEVCALAEKDREAAHVRVGELTSAHYSDWNLLLMFASLLTSWAAFDEAGSGAALCDEAFALLDRVLDHATDPSTLFLARQQKATTLFQMGDYDGAAALLERLVGKQDAGTPLLLLVSAYRRLGRESEALELLQSRRLQAATFVLSSLMQEMGVREDPVFAGRAASAARAVHDALDLQAVNPFFVPTMEAELAEALRAAGDTDGALAALGRAVDALASAETEQASLSFSPLYDHAADRLDPSRVGDAWAEHKERQADGALALMRRGLSERVASSEWRELAGDDPRYQEIVGRLASL